MRFSVAVFLFGVTTVVSALPISQSTSSLELGGRDVTDMFKHNFDERATADIYRRTTEHQIAVHKSHVGTPYEHWSLHFHPENKHPSAEWHIIHAVGGGKEFAGVLKTNHVIMGGEHIGYDPAAHQGDHHHILGSISTAKETHALESLTKIKCTSHFPGENCVDWTKKAVDHLHANGHIDDKHHAEFMKDYDKHAEDVRTVTHTSENLMAAGHPKSVWKKKLVKNS